MYYPPGHVPFEKKDGPAVVGGGYEQSSVSITTKYHPAITTKNINY